MSEKGYLYTLHDPRNGSVKYVGVTKNPKKRKKSHVTNPTNQNMEAWVNELARNDLQPQMKIRRIEPVERLSEIEAQAISDFNSEYDLLNEDTYSTYSDSHTSDKSAETVNFANGQIQYVLATKGETQSFSERVRELVDKGIEAEEQE